MSQRERGAAAAMLAAMVWCAVIGPHRAAAIDATWNADAVGNWSDGANWDTDPMVPVTTADSATIGSGVVTIDDEFSIGQLTWTGGSLVRSATAVDDSVLTVEGAATISGPDFKSFATTTLNLNGATTWSEGTINTVETVENPEGGVVNIGGAFDVQFDAAWTWNNTATPTINVAAAGSIVKSAGEGTAVFFPLVHNDGLVDVQMGTLHLAGGGASSGSFTVANGATLQFSDFFEGYAAAGAETTTLGVDTVVDASTGGTVRFTNSFGNSRTDVYGSIDATVVDADPGELGLVLFHAGSSLGATTRGSYTANSGVTAFDAISPKVIDVIVNDEAVIDVVNNATLSSNGAINVNEGGVLLVGNLTSAGSIFLDDATQQQLITGLGQIVLGHSSSSIDAAYSLRIDGDMTVSGRGRITGKISGPANGTNQGTIVSDVIGGTMRTDFLDNTFAIQGMDGGSIDYRDATNTGTISVAGGGNLLTTNLVNSGIVTINGGTLDLNGANWDNTAGTGVINATNASIVMRGDLTFANVGAINRTNSELFLQGTLQNAAQTLNLDNSTGERGSWVMNSGTSARIVGGTVQTSGGARLVFRGSSAGTLEGVTLKSAPLFENGTTIFVASGLTLDNVTLDLSNGGTGAATITFIAGSRLISGTGQIVFGNADNRGIDNQVGNVQATIGPNISIRGQLGRLAGGGAGILLQGSASADVSGGQISLDNVTIAAGGVGEAKNGGRLLLQGNWDNNGTLRVMNGSTLDLFGTFDTPDVGVVERTGTTTVQMFGVLTNTSQTFDIHTSTGSLVLRSGGTILGGRVQSSGASALTASIDGGGSTLNGVTLATNMSFASGVGGLVNASNGLTLDNATIDMATGGTGRVLSFGGGAGTRTLGGTGEVVLGLSSTLRNGMTAGGVLTIAPGVTVRGQGTIDGNAFGGAGGILNQGTVQADAGQMLSVRQATNAGGVMRASASHTLRLLTQSPGETTFVQTGGELSAAATGSIVSARGIDIRSGKLSGGGTVQLLSDVGSNATATATSGGVISPGDSLGTLTVDGNVIIGDGGRLAIELSGATTDLLSIVKGQFQQAAGNLDLSSANDFLDVTKLGPLTATSYVIATYVGTLSGTFDHVTAGYSVTYDTALKRVLLIAPPRADFDLDGNVDGDDFLVWQRGLGISSGATRAQGDANGDGAVNAEDLALWRSQFGTPGSTAASASVPEPGSVALALAAFGSAASGVRRRRVAERAIAWAN